MKAKVQLLIGGGRVVMRQVIPDEDLEIDFSIPPSYAEDLGRDLIEAAKKCREQMVNAALECLDE